MPPAHVRFDAVNVIVTDMAASRAFYERLGLSFANSHEPVWDDHHIASVTSDDGVAAVDVDLDSASFADKWNQGWPGGPGVVLGCKVESRQAVDDLVAELEAAGATVQQPPFDAFWGARYAVVADPDGNAVGIMSPADAAHRSEAPDPR